MYDLWLSRLAKETQAIVKDSCTTMTYKVGETVITYKDQTKDVFFIQKGFVQVENYTYGGRLVYLATFGPESVIGHFAAIKDIKRTANVIAKTDCSVVRCPQHIFMKIITLDPENAQNMMEILVDILHKNAKRLEAISGLEAQGRIVTYLIEQVSQSNQLVMIPKRDILASYLNMTRETLSREIAKLVQEGLIKKINPKTIQVLDKQALIEILRSS